MSKTVFHHEKTYQQVENEVYKEYKKYEKFVYIGGIIGGLLISLFLSTIFTLISIDETGQSKTTYCKTIDDTCICRPSIVESCDDCCIEWSTKYDPINKAFKKDVITFSIIIVPIMLIFLEGRYRHKIRDAINDRYSQQKWVEVASGKEL